MLNKFSIVQKRMASLIAIAAVITIVGCSKNDNPTAPSKAGTFVGEQKAMGNGTIRSWVKLDDNGNPTSIGVTFTETALVNLTTDSMGTRYALSLPSQSSAIAINHIEVDWETYGHEPKGIYTLPHFDFHFYMVTTQEQTGVIPGPDTIPVPAQFIPANYSFGPAPIAVPNMGVHYVDVTSPEFQGQKFTKTFIFGYYRGSQTFIEPMVTKEYIESKPNSSTAIKQPAAYQRTGKYYPTTYSVSYSSTAKEYTVSLDAMTMK